MSDLTPEQKEVEKEVMKEAIEEWLDKQFAKFGKWSLGTLLAGAIVWLFYGFLNIQGWHK
jgi:hypothetical protein